VSNIPPKHTLNYSWKSTGGEVQGKTTTATIDTKGLQPGNYTVTAGATDTKPRKDQGPLSCTANFTVNAPPPPPQASITCSANPASVESGNTSAIAVSATNPGNVQLSYNYTTTAGRVTGNGESATLDTAGANPGPITVTATATDQLGRSVTCNAQVTVAEPPKKVQAEKLGECSFTIDKKRPARVDNECKGKLDDVALRLQRESDAKLVVVGHGDPSEKNGATLAAQRAVNSKLYLTEGEAKQGIDPSRIEARSGDQTGQSAEFWLVPPGAEFTAPGQVVDEQKVKGQSRTAPAKKPRRKAAAAPKA